MSTNLKTSEILERGREKIESLERWTQGEYARLSDKKPCATFHPDANCFCALGALDAVIRGDSQRYGSLLCYGHDSVRLLATAINPERVAEGSNIGPEMLPSIYFNLVHTFNDENTHFQMLAKFDEAIALAKAEENAV